MSDEHRLTPQEKPKKTLNYQEKVKAGLVSGGMKRSALNKFSKKTKEKLDTYHQLDTLSSNIFTCEHCELTFDKEQLDKHHPYGRGNFTSEFIYITRDFHDWIHKNPNKAFELGWLQPQYRGLAYNPNHPVPFKIREFNCVCQCIL